MHHFCQCNPCRCGDDTAALANSAGPAETLAFGARHKDPATRAVRSLRQRRSPRCLHASAVSDPQVGAHLVTPRRGYTHHGIYAGDGTVLHYAGLSRAMRGGPVEIVTLSAFAHGRPVYVACRSVLAFAAGEVLKRAHSRLGENEYHLIRNNCEHYVAWARYGVNRSAQVEQWLGPAASALHGLTSVLRRSVSTLKTSGQPERAAA